MESIDLNLEESAVIVNALARYLTYPTLDVDQDELRLSVYSKFKKFFDRLYEGEVIN